MAELGDGKKKPSGAQNRKRKLEKEEKIKKLISPIDSFFRPGTSSSTSTRHLEETVNLEERSSQVPAHTSTSTSPTPSEPIVNQPATEPDPKELEKLEEAKLKAKFPNAMMGRGPQGQSAFLQKSLAKGQKFFDSGDYEMAKQRPSNLAAPFKTPAKHPTGDAIPTPETVPIRKTSIIQPKFQ